MKLFSAQQIREADQFTIQSYGIRSWELMEQAARQCIHWINENLPNDSIFIVLCGCGNNGGDGLAITRLLHENGFPVKAFLLKTQEQLSVDAERNYQKLLAIGADMVSIVEKDNYLTTIAPHLIIIDAILGTGINRPITGWLGLFIKHINSLPNQKISIDIPSGLAVDAIDSTNDCIVQASFTLSFEFYKRSFLHVESQAFIGKVCLLPIGIHPQFCKETHSHYFLTDKEYLCSIYQPRPPFSHKGSYGHAAIAGGSYGMMGAIALASKACLRSGVGKITALIPEAGYTMFQTLVPEAMCLTQSEKYISSFEQFCNNKNYSIVAIGPGLGLMDVTIKAFIQFIETHKSNLVLDADALNMLSQHKELLHQLHPNTILTPHHKEFERLFGTSTNTLQRVETARSMAMLHNVIIVLKGHHTTILTPEGECWYNSTGNAGMATAGSGDVLTGIILALIAQNYEPKEAAIMGVYLHGLAGDKAVEKLGMESLTASDLIQYLPEAFKSLQNSH